jgi:malate permease and related proteins
MLQVINTIIPVFAVILLGLALRSWELLPVHLLGPLNRLVYYLAIPAMIFREVARAEFQAHFHPLLLAGTLVPVVIMFLLALSIGRFHGISPRQMGTFLQSSFHGNLGYIALAIAYYLLGEDGFTSASILSGFLMLLQNFLAVLALQMFYQGPEEGHRSMLFMKKILGNPVVLGALSGILFSMLKIPIPEIIDNSLKIIGGMALPLALLVIGASLSFTLLRSHFRLAFGAGVLKLFLLPGLGLLLYFALRIPSGQFLPGLILLASPTATITYVMASEMQGSPDLATAAVSMNTLLSALTFVLWLSPFT